VSAFGLAMSRLPVEGQRLGGAFPSQTAGHGRHASDSYPRAFIVAEPGNETGSRAPSCEGFSPEHGASASRSRSISWELREVNVSSARELLQHRFTGSLQPFTPPLLDAVAQFSHEILVSESRAETRTSVFTTNQVTRTQRSAGDMFRNTWRPPHCRPRRCGSKGRGVPDR
jgi:hypothetical protein